MTDEISNKVSFNDRLTCFKSDVKDYFEAPVIKNDNSVEECLEVYLIRDGYRIVNKAEEIINIQKAKIEELKAENEKSKCKICTLEGSIETLKEMNEQLGVDVDRKYNLICKLEEDLRDSKSNAIKEFAERLKLKLQWDCEFSDKLVFENDIDNLVKEMTEE